MDGTFLPTIEGLRKVRPAAVAWLGLTVVGVVIGAWYVALLGDGGRPVDGHTYFQARLDHLYVVAWPGTDGYTYAPAFAQALAPLVATGWSTFMLVGRAAAAGSVVVLAGPLSPLAFLASSVASEINALNVHLFVAMAVVLGFRWPAAWAFILLTKVTPGVGLAWFAARREWRSLAIALGATALIAGASFILAPGQWADWALALTGATRADPGWTPVTGPLWLRMVLGGAIAAWGGRTDRAWTVPVAVMLSLPAVWWPALSILVATIPFLIWSPATWILPSRLRPTRWRPVLRDRPGAPPGGVREPAGTVSS